MEAPIYWPSFFFLLFSAIACAFALAVVITPNVVRMAFYLVLSLAATAGLFFLAGADFVGLVFHPRSPRNLGLDAARILAARMRGRVKIVALLSDPRDEHLGEVMAAVKPDLLQLHGAETVERDGEIVDANE